MHYGGKFPYSVCCTFLDVYYLGRRCYLFRFLNLAGVCCLSFLETRGVHSSPHLVWRFLELLIVMAAETPRRRPSHSRIFYYFLFFIIIYYLLFIIYSNSSSTPSLIKKKKKPPLQHSSLLFYFTSTSLPTPQASLPSFSTNRAPKT